jgi:metallo-beta-lactamase family protein
MSNKQVSISFESGARSVTGSNFLIEFGNKKFLVDCGLEQGSKYADEQNHDPFAYDPASIDVLFVTHGHLDHVGRIGKLVKDGFRGQIYSTPPTKEIGELVMIDSMKIVNRAAEEIQKEPLYLQGDVDNALARWNTKDYHEPMIFDCDGEPLTVTFRDAGHILGSSMVVFSYKGTKIAFTGDLGNTPSTLMADTEVMRDIDYLAIESVYGDRNHEMHFERKQKLQDIILRTVKEKGILIIPAFSVERTQELLFELNDMVENKEVPRVPTYLDSPLAIKVTDVFKRNKKYLNKSVQERMKSDDIFDFPGLIRVGDSEESKAIKEVPGPKIIIAGAGMMNGGRVVHHAKNYLNNPHATLLVVGYQAPGTLARLLVDGIKMVRIFGIEVEVRAQVETLTGYSAHKDSDDLVSFVEPMVGRLKKVFVILGELKASLFLAQRIKDTYNVEVSVPDKGDKVIVPLVQ